VEATMKAQIETGELTRLDAVFGRNLGRST
jgi:hypothetical protein